METTVIRLEDLSRDEMRLLIERSAGPCASIFMPIEWTNPARQHNPLRLKNLFWQAEERLIAHGQDAAAARSILAPGYQLIEDQSFWDHQSNGLAIFAATDLFRVYRLPLAFEELVIVDQHAHITPLLTMLSGDSHFSYSRSALGACGYSMERSTICVQSRSTMCPRACRTRLPTRISPKSPGRILACQATVESAV